MGSCDVRFGRFENTFKNGALRVALHKLLQPVPVVALLTCFMLLCWPLLSTRPNLCCLGSILALDQS